MNTKKPLKEHKECWLITDIFPSPRVMNNNQLTSHIINRRSLPAVKPILKYCYVFLFLLLGCAATPYQASSWSGGYSDWSLEQANTYGVQFSGNGKSTLQQAKDYALLRSAELCLEQGFQYFYILETSIKQKKVDVGTGELGGTKIYVHKPTVTMKIQLIHTATESQLDLFNASDVLNKIMKHS